MDMLEEAISVLTTSVQSVSSNERVKFCDENLSAKMALLSNLAASYATQGNFELAHKTMTSLATMGEQCPSKEGFSDLLEL